MAESRLNTEIIGNYRNFEKSQVYMDIFHENCTVPVTLNGRIYEKKCLEKMIFQGSFPSI